MMPDNAISFQLWSALDAADSLREQLQTLKSLGYTDVQPYHDQYDDPRGMKTLLDEIGLTARTGHFNMDMVVHEFDRVVDAARVLGMGLVVAPYIAPEARPATVDGWKILGALLQGCAELYAEAGLAFAWHNHEFEFFPLPDGSFPIEHLLGERLLWEIDVAWVARAGVDPLPWIRRYAGRIPAVHVKDMAPPGEKLDEDGWADVGTGVLDWQTFWPATVAAGSRLMIAEHDKPSDYRRFAANSIIAMRKLAAST